MHEDYRINWMQPVPPIGEKVVAPAPAPAPDPVKLFETGRFELDVPAKPKPATPTVPPLVDEVAAHYRQPFPAVLPTVPWVYEVFAAEEMPYRRFSYWDGGKFCPFVTARTSVERAIKDCAPSPVPTKMQVTAWRVAPEHPLP